MREERADLSRNAEVAKAMDYMLKRREALVRFLDDGRICLGMTAEIARAAEAPQMAVAPPVRIPYSSPRSSRRGRKRPKK